MWVYVFNRNGNKCLYTNVDKNLPSLYIVPKLITAWDTFVWVYVCLYVYIHLLCIVDGRYWEFNQDEKGMLDALLSNVENTNNGANLNNNNKNQWMYAAIFFSSPLYVCFFFLQQNVKRCYSKKRGEDECARWTTARFKWINKGILCWDQQACTRHYANGYHHAYQRKQPTKKRRNVIIFSGRDEGRRCKARQGESSRTKRVKGFHSHESRFLPFV